MTKLNVRVGATTIMSEVFLCPSLYTVDRTIDCFVVYTCTSLEVGEWLSSVGVTQDAVRVSRARGRPAAGGRVGQPAAGAGVSHHAAPPAPHAACEHDSLASHLHYVRCRSNSDAGVKLMKYRYI